MKLLNFSITISKIRGLKFLRINISKILCISIALLALISQIITPQNASAKDSSSTRSIIIVTTFEDEFDAGPDCSLREAITAANSDTDFGGCIADPGTDTIQLTEGTYILTRPGSKEDLNATGDLDIFSNVTILGTGSDKTIIDGSDLDRIFDINQPAGPVTVRFESMKITNGTAPGGSANSDGESGGGIRSQGNLELDQVIIYSNYAGNGGNETGNGGHGGGIFCAGDLTIYDSVIQNNYAGNGGSLVGLGTAGNGGDGGGIMAMNNLIIENSQILSNRAGNSGDGIFGQQSYTGNGGSGGGIIITNSGSATISNTEIRSNFGGNVGVGPGSSVSGGKGGGIYNAGDIDISFSTLSYNRPGRGTNSLLYAGSGGGLHNASGATAYINSSGIHDNSEASAGLYPRGGGIYNSGILSLINTTIAENEEPYEGGGIYNSPTGYINLNASTIVHNQSQYGGGIYNASGTVNLKNTLVSYNVGWQGGYDCEGDMISEGYNFIRDLTTKMGGPPYTQVCLITGDLTGMITGTENNPTISAIGYYGGDTKTYIPMTGSLLIDAGNPAAPGSGGNSCPALDQREVSRPQADHCDIGASEATPQFTVTKNVDFVYTYPGQLVTFTITVNNIGGLDSLDTTIYDDLPIGLNFEGPVTLTPEHPEGIIASSAGDLPELVTNLVLAAGESVEVSLPVTMDTTYPGGEIIANIARAFSPIPQSEGTGYRNIRTGWRLSLPLIIR